jgi:hypothetical protein
MIWGVGTNFALYCGENNLLKEEEKERKLFSTIVGSYLLLSLYLQDQPVC